VSTPLDDGPFFHGTIADLGVGELLTPGRRSNYRPEIVMNHVYFTALVDGAGLAAEIAAELADTDATPRVYAVEPTGAFGRACARGYSDPLPPLSPARGPDRRGLPARDRRCHGPSRTAG
jgi:hypothetical protein